MAAQAVRRRLPAIAMALLAFTAGGPALAQGKAPPDAAARAGTEQILASLENRPCPALGDTGYVGGVAAGSLATAIASEEAGANQISSALRAMLADPAVSERKRAEFWSLGSWSLAGAYARLSLLRLAEQAQKSPTVEDNGPHPIVPLATHEARLDSVRRESRLTPDAAAAFGRISARLSQCRKELGAQILAANEPGLQAAIQSAPSTTALRAVGQRYRLSEDGAGSALAASFNQQMAALTTRENTRSASKSAPAAPSPAGPPPAQLATARRFVLASNSGNEAAALAELSEDVVLQTPQGTFSGKAQVRETVRRERSSGRAGTMQPPVASGSAVIARGKASGFGVTTRFYFNASHKIQRMVVSLG